VRVTRQADGELGELADPAIDPDCAAMLLGHDVIADRTPKPRPLAGRLGGEEWLEQLVLDLGPNASTVVADADLDRIAEISCRYLEGWLEPRIASPFRRSVAA
jgi:hypothetical protein